jgi:TRAP-type C4-dicarboxylate transport system permease small subunit
MKVLDQIDLLLSKGLMIVGGIALLSLMILATGNVVLRILHVPFSGCYEIISFLGAIVTAAALGYTQRNRDHIIVDILSDKFPPGVKKIVDAASYLIVAIFFAVVARQTLLWGLQIRESGELSETLKIIYHPFIFGVALGFAFLGLSGAVDFFKVLFNSEDGEGRVYYE